MNKKTYIQPDLTIDMMEEVTLLAESVTGVTGLDDVTVSDKDFTGGDADARGNGSIWDED